MGRFQVVTRPITNHRGTASLTTRVYEKLSASKRGWTVSELAQLFEAENDSVRKSVYRLHEDGFLMRTEGDGPHRYHVTNKVPPQPRNIGPQRSARSRL